MARSVCGTATRSRGSWNREKPVYVGWAGSQSGTTKPWMALLSAISANVEYVIFLGSVLLGTVIMVTIRRIFSTRRSASPRAILPCGSEDDFSTSL
ncbi:MAG: hypothetical protein AUI95_04240 [Crenarchaeota archaeon 13_1_40CM_3_52_4]|nr:MAG: hypothetical protein AUI95_04240 [Crenarchaeota archaeon 13_1_40CM_3_52_4]